MNADPSNTANTPERLLNALRRTTGIDDLDWATPPTPLSGGFWAEMFAVELEAPPAEWNGPLVARVMPDADTAAMETAIQRHAHRCGLPVPAIVAASGPTPELDQAWMLMEYDSGAPLLGGLTALEALRRAPTVFRGLPDLLARAASQLHRCPTSGPELDPYVERAGISAFLDRIADRATLVGRNDLAAAARLLATQSPAEQVVCHGDLHPFNLLVSGDSWTLIDWSTAVIADPHYDLGFTTLLLANPPLGGPTPLRLVAERLSRRLARRFLRTYAKESGRSVDADRLRWGQSVHAVRALTELAKWESDGSIEKHRGHPWIELRPVLEANLPTHPTSP